MTAAGRCSDLAAARARSDRLRIRHVVVEDTDVIVLFQPASTICKKRTGRRGGPGGRCLIEWDGGHEDVASRGPPQVKVYVPGTAHAVQRSWNGTFEGWYVNLESPWVRTPLGFDTWDQVLDIEVADDLSWWRWKDEDELDWSVAAGKVTSTEADAIRAEGERVMKRLEARASPFDDGWTRWRPDKHWPIPAIPPGWDDASF